MLMLRMTMMAPITVTMMTMVVMMVNDSDVHYDQSSVLSRAGGCGLEAWAKFPGCLPLPSFRTFVLETKQPAIDSKLYGVVLVLHPVVGEVAERIITVPRAFVLLTRFPVRGFDCRSDWSDHLSAVDSDEWGLRRGHDCHGSPPAGRASFYCGRCGDVVVITVCVFGSFSRSFKKCCGNWQSQRAKAVDPGVCRPSARICRRLCRRDNCRQVLKLARHDSRSPCSHTSVTPSGRWCTKRRFPFQTRWQ